MNFGLGEVRRFWEFFFFFLGHSLIFFALLFFLLPPLPFFQGLPKTFDPLASHGKSAVEELFGHCRPEIGNMLQVGREGREGRGEVVWLFIYLFF